MYVENRNYEVLPARANGDLSRDVKRNDSATRQYRSLYAIDSEENVLNYLAGTAGARLRPRMA